MGTHAEPIPHEPCPVQPYAAAQFPGVFKEPACSVTTVVARRTFWEKATILHAEYHRPLDKPLLPRYSRHYADMAAMALAPVKTEALVDLEYFAQRLAKFARNIVVLQGGMGKKQRKAIMARLATIPDGEERVLIATGRYVGEGFDDARLDTLFLVTPISWRGTLQQYVGRLHRLHAGKRIVQVYDYADLQVPMLRRMYEKRVRGYKLMGYEIPEDDKSCEGQKRFY